MRKILPDITLMVLVIIWGSTFFMIKGHVDSIDPVAMVFYRFGIAAICVGLWLSFKRQKFFDRPLPGMLVGLFLYLMYIPQNIGMQYTSASNSGFITALYVGFIPIISIVFFKQWPKLNRLVAGGISLVGLWFLTGGIHALNYGDWITLVAALAVSFYVLVCDHHLKNQGEPLSFLFVQFLTTAVLGLVTMWVFALPFGIQRESTYIVMVYLTFFATLLTFVGYVYIQRVLTPMKCAVIFALEPVSAAFFAWQYGGEVFGAMQIFGGALIVLAMVVSEINNPLS